MKKCTLLFALSFSFQMLVAQAWALFPGGQRTFWDDGEEINLYYNDVTLPGNFTNRHYFGAEYLTQDSSFVCYNKILEDWYQFEKPPIDSLFSTPENWFALMEGGMVPFFHLAEPGYSWTVESNWTFALDSIVFNCESKTLETIFDLEDSVKTFSLLAYKSGNSQNYFNYPVYRLSKNFGFTEYFPLQKLDPNEDGKNKKIVGFNNGQAHGFTNSWEDYFGHFELGQLLKWKELNALVYSPPGCAKIEEHYIDSIMSIAFTSDSLLLEVYREGETRCWEDSINNLAWDSSTPISEIKTIKYLRSEYDPFFDIPPGWFNFIEVTGGYYTDLTWPIIYDNDSLFHVCLESNFAFSDPMDECIYIHSHPMSFPTQLKTCLGLVFEGWGGGFSGEAQYKELVGYTKNGEAFGEINGTFSQAVRNLAIHIFPNPVTDNLHIELSAKSRINTMNLKITDVSGKIVLHKKWNDEFGKIDVSDLPTGIYFIFINGEGFFGGERFVKN